MGTVATCIEFSLAGTAFMYVHVYSTRHHWKPPKGGFLFSETMAR